MPVPQTFSDADFSQSSEAGFDQIALGFFRAVRGHISWNQALLPLQRAVSAWMVQLHGVDLARQTVTFLHVAGDLPAEAVVDYVRQYHRLDPRAELAVHLPPGQWFNCWDHFDDGYVANSVFYQEFLIPYGGRYVSKTKLLQNGPVSVFLSVHRGRGSLPMDADEQAFCRRQALYLADALRFNEGYLQPRQIGGFGIEFLAQLEIPVALLDERARLRFANAAARSLLFQNKLIIDTEPRLTCSRREDDAVLLQALATLTTQYAMSGDRPNGKRFCVAVHGSSGDCRLALYLHGIHPQASMGAFGDEYLVLTLFHQRDARLEIDPLLIAATYDLTPAEARVAASLARGLSPDQISLASGVAISTIRTQLRSIFEKTGTSRQTELVSALGRLPAIGFQVPAGERS